MELQVCVWNVILPESSPTCLVDPILEQVTDPHCSNKGCNMTPSGNSSYALHVASQCSPVGSAVTECLMVAPTGGSEPGLGSDYQPGGYAA